MTGTPTPAYPDLFFSQGARWTLGHSKRAVMSRMREDGKDTITESRTPEPGVTVLWNRVAFVVVALAVAGLLGLFALTFLFRVVFPW